MSMTVTYQRISSAKFIRIEFDARGREKIYAQADKWDEDAWHYLLASIHIIACFFNEASVNDEAMLISSD